MYIIFILSTGEKPTSAYGHSCAPHNLSIHSTHDNHKASSLCNKLFTAVTFQKCFRNVLNSTQTNTP